MRPLSDKSVKTIATVIPEVLNSTSKRKRVPKEAVLNSVRTFLRENDYEVKTLELAMTRIERDLSSVFGAAKTYPKDKIGEELHFALRYMHLSPHKHPYIYVDNTIPEPIYHYIWVNTTMEAEEIQNALPNKMTKERFLQAMQSAPFFFSIDWDKQVYSERRRQELPKIYAHNKGLTLKLFN